MKKTTLAIIALLCFCSVTKAQDEKFKALYMFNFTKYIEWPQVKQSGDFVIGVVGSSAIIDELNAIAQRKAVGSQSIKVREVSSSDDLTKFHIVYVCESKSDQAASIATKIKGKGVVLITDKPGMASKAGINYIKKDGKQSFEICKRLLTEEGVTASAQLLALGTAVD